MRGFKFFFQHDIMQCGAACLRMVLHHHGRRYSMNAVEEVCPPTSQGVSALSICKGAEQLGLKAVAGNLSADLLPSLPHPCVLHWNQNHFVVLYKVGRSLRGDDIYYIADPGKGKLKVRRDELLRHWGVPSDDGGHKGIVLVFENTDMALPQDVADSSPRHSVKFFLDYLRRYKAYFFQVFAGLLAGCLLQLVLPFLTQAIVDSGIQQKNLQLVWLILIGQLMLLISSSAIDFIRRWLLLFIGVRINISLVSDFFIKLVRLPMPFFDTKQTGDILQRMNDHARIQQFLTSEVLSILFAMLSTVVFSVVLCMYSVRIFLVFMAFSAVYMVWTMLFLQRRKVLDYCNFEKSAESQNKTFQMITNMQEIKLQNCEVKRRTEWEDVQVDLAELQMKNLRLQQTQEAGGILIEGSKNLVVTALAAIAVINGELTLGMMLSLQYILGQLASPVYQLLGLVYSMQDIRISLERINEIMDRPDEDSGKSGAAAFDSSRGGIAFDGVSFAYEKYSRHRTIDDISFDIPQGKTTAIVGASGSGKTTLLKLLLGYYAPAEGAISVGGHSLADYDMEWWRKRCGVVMQEGAIFSDTIAGNIAVGDGTQPDRDRLERAAAMACLDDYIAKLPLKYSTVVGPDGMGLSMGQKQRILIARAIYKDPDYLFLDEATNSLDADNERRIAANLAEFYKGRTVLLIAHRLSTVRNADNIIVLGQGRILEQGTHEQLIAKRGEYYELVRNQLNV